MLWSSIYQTKLSGTIEIRAKLQQANKQTRIHPHTYHKGTDNTIVFKIIDRPTSPWVMSTQWSITTKTYSTANHKSLKWFVYVWHTFQRPLVLVCLKQYSKTVNEIALFLALFMRCCTYTTLVLMCLSVYVYLAGYRMATLFTSCAVAVLAAHARRRTMS